MEKKLLHKKEGIMFRKYLIPSMLSMLAVSAYSFVDTFVVGQGVGADAVAAMGLGTPVVSLLYALGFLLGSGGAINYAVLKGSGDKRKANSIFSMAFWGAIVLWLLIGICGNIRINEVVLFLGATPGNRQLTIEYLRWILSFSGVLILDLVMNNFMRNEGHPNVSMIATITGTGMNIILDFLFVMGFGWGMSGAAFATCFASVVSVLINISYAVIKKTNLVPSIRNIGFRKLPDILSIGFGSFVLEGAVAVISVIFLNYAGTQYGDEGVSAFSVLMTLNLVVYSLLNGVAQAIQPLVSLSYASGNKKSMRIYARYGLMTSVALGVFFCVVGEIFTGQLVKIFVKDCEGVFSLATYGLHFFAVTFIFMSVSILLGIYFQSETKPVQALIVLLGRSAVMPVIMLYLLNMFCGKISLWIAIPIGEFIAMLTAWILFQRERWCNRI